MNNEKFYINPDLRLNDLAIKLKANKNEITKVIKHYTKSNFYNFINTYRLTEFKQQLELDKKQQFTIEALAKDSGFKSKSSFYTFFNEKEGISPSKYRNKII
jgi:AraC-like DNA-binding protein